MKQSVTIEQVAKNLGTTVELAKTQWMKNIVSENGFTLVDPFKGLYLSDEAYKEMKDAQALIVPDLFADEQDKMTNQSMKQKISSIISKAITLDQAFSILK